MIHAHSKSTHRFCVRGNKNMPADAGLFLASKSTKTIDIDFFYTKYPIFKAIVTDLTKHNPDHFKKIIPNRG